MATQKMTGTRERAAVITTTCTEGAGHVPNYGLLRICRKRRTPSAPVAARTSRRSIPNGSGIRLDAGFAEYMPPGAAARCRCSLRPRTLRISTSGRRIPGRSFRSCRACWKSAFLCFGT